MTWPLLEADRRWVRRLAAALVRDEAEAEDLAQEAWEVALRKPPRKGAALRAWFRQVMRRRLQNERRGETRRRAREDATTGPEPLATPEEITARVELVRRTLALLAELPEAERQVLHLRYFEDRDTDEIARRLGVAEGTVRWRVKMALDQLRARLDHETGGDRRRWRALLLPFAFPRPSRRRELPWISASRGALLLLATGTLTAILWAVRGVAPTPTGTGDATMAIARPSQDRSPPRLSAPLPDLSTCPEARAVRDELELRTRELESVEELDRQFAKGAPNPAAEENFGKIWRPLLGTPPGCPYTFECRGLVCRVQVLLADSQTSDFEDACFVSPSRARHQLLRDYLNRRRSLTIGNATPVRDPVSNVSATRFDFLYALASPTGAPVAWATQPEKEPLAPGRYRVWPAPGSDRSAACKDAFARLEGELATILARGDELLRLEEAFAINEPNPQQVPEVVKLLAEVTGLSGAPFPLRVECRGNVCSLEPRDPTDPRLGTKEVCHEAEGRRICQLVPEGSGWLSRLDKAQHRHEQIGRVDPAAAGRPTLLRLRSALERGRADPFQEACAFGERVRNEDVLRACEREMPGTGTLDLKVNIPGPDDPNRQITLDHAGTLDGQPLGRCIVTRLQALAAAVELPVTRSGLVLPRSLDFPGASDLWTGRDPCRLGLQ